MAARTAGKIHKWLALVMAVPILFWFASGLFFAIAPIERVRSEHRIADLPALAIAPAEAAAGLERIAAGGAGPGERYELKAMLGRPVVLVTAAGERPRLYDLTSGRLVSPVPATLAVEIAEADHDGAERVVRVVRVEANSTEYRGALPAWRVDFEGGASRSLYVAADTGAVAARRSTLWRVFDFLWALHILDFKERQDFNTPLLIAAAALAMIVLITGVIMFPSRLGLTGWRRRRQARGSEPGPQADQ